MSEFYSTHSCIKSKVSYLRQARWLVAAFATMVSLSVVAQQVGEYRTVTNGKWTNTGIWQVYNGTTWVTPTSAPAFAGNVVKVTVSSGTIVNLTTDIFTYKVDTINLYGTLVGTAFAMPSHLNFEYMEIFPDSTAATPLTPGGGLRWDANGAGIRIPYSASIAYPPNYRGIEALNSEDPQNCGNNIGLYLGGGLFGQPEVLYATCRGQLEGVCLSFANVNEVGGIIRTVPIIPIPAAVGDKSQSCELEFETTMTVLGVPKDALVSASIFGEKNGNTVSTVPQNVTGIVDGGNGDLDMMINGAVTFGIKIVATGYEKYPVVVSVNKGYGPNSPAACRDFGLVTNDTIDFEFVAPPTLDIDVQTTACNGSNAGATLTNTSTVNHIGVFWAIDDVDQPAVVVAPSSTAMLNVPASGGGSTKLTIKSFSYAAPSPTFPCANEVNLDYFITSADATALAIDLDSNTQQVFGSADLTASQGCRLISSLASFQITSVVGKAFVANGVIAPAGQPIVGRRVWMEPAAGNTTIYDKVTLYALNSEFEAFNAATVSNQLLPVTPNDPENYRANLRVYRYDFGEYDPATGLPTVPIAEATVINPADIDIAWSLSNNYWEISFPSTPLGLFIIGNENFIILPLTLLDFEAQLIGKANVDLTWKTTDERDVLGFEVEVSSTGTEFRKVGFVQARNAVGTHSYDFNTMMPSKLGYFRLKMMDKNGDFTYSPVRLLKSGNTIVNAYPNPANGVVNIDLTGYPAGQVRVMDLSGRVISAARTVSGMNKINTQALANGMYMVEVIVGQERELIKVAVVH